MLLEVKNLKKHFPVESSSSTVKAVDDISFFIEKGTTFGLVGESGCGKSTVARLIVKLYNANAGSIIFEGKDITKLTRKQTKAFRRDVQMVFQDPYASLNPRMTVYRTIIDPLDIFGIGNRLQRNERVDELLALVGLDNRYARRYPHEFSGGQRQRIGIARALALNPKLIVLDEPVSALDVSIQAQILNLLNELQEKLGLTYLFISHDLSVVEYLSDQIGVMYLGHIVEYGSRTDIFAHPGHPYTQALLSAIPELDPDSSKEQILLKGDLPSPSNPPSGCPFNTRCWLAEEICFRQKPSEIEVSPGHFVACHMVRGK